jgi:Flp pilus assembly pilin Flp
VWFRLLQSERGASLVEYLIGLAVMAAVAFAVRETLVPVLRNAHDNMVDNITRVQGTGG